MDESNRPGAVVWYLARAVSDKGCLQAVLHGRIKEAGDLWGENATTLEKMGITLDKYESLQ
jgi:hypothetical protein